MEKFEFGVSFDEPGSFAFRRKQPAEATYTEEDISEAKDAARTEGYAQGEQDALGRIEQQILTAVGSVAEGLDAVVGQVDEQFDAMRREAVRIAVKVNRCMFPSSEESHAENEIVRLVEIHLDQRLEAPRLVLRLHPTLVESVRERLMPMIRTADFENRFLFMPDDRMGLGDCRLEWDQGGAEREQDRLWSEMETAADCTVPGSLADDAASDAEPETMAVEPAAPEGASEDTAAEPQDPPARAEGDHVEATTPAEDGAAASEAPDQHDDAPVPSADPAEVAERVEAQDDGAAPGTPAPVEPEPGAAGAAEDAAGAADAADAQSVEAGDEPGDAAAAPAEDPVGAPSDSGAAPAEDAGGAEVAPAPTEEEAVPPAAVPTEPTLTPSAPSAGSD